MKKLIFVLALFMCSCAADRMQEIEEETPVRACEYPREEPVEEPKNR